MLPHLWALSLPIGTILIFVPRVASLVLQVKSGVPPKNTAPRELAEGKEVAAKDTHGYVRRAYAAHQNSWESMILWSTAVMLARTTGVSTERINLSAGFWLAARVAYIPSYILITSETKSFIRSAVFAVGLASTVSLMFAAVDELK